MSNTVLPFVQPILPSGSRLVPALIGTSARNVVVYIECPNWCTDDHMRPTAVEDVTHYADAHGFSVFSFCEGADMFNALNASLEADPAASDSRMRDAHVLVWDDSAKDGARLTEDMADELADRLVGFAAQVRQLARTARLANRDARAERVA